MIKLCYAALFFMLCACDVPENNHVPQAVNFDVFRQIDGTTQEFSLRDGTKCVTWKYANAGGISCDWHHK